VSTEQPTYGQPAKKPNWVDTIAGSMLPIGLLAMFITPGIWAYQIIYWLRSGDWFPISIADGLHWIGIREPRFAWMGVQKISDFVMDLPLSIMIFFAILGIMFAIVEWSERYGAQAKAKKATS
jgi:hypothetical protein